MWMPICRSRIVTWYHFELHNSKYYSHIDSHLFPWCQVFFCDLVATIHIPNIPIDFQPSLPHPYPTTPCLVPGVDEIVTVLAGSLLWLDCSSLATQTDDLQVVGWRKEFLKFYNQYNNPLLGANFGYPLNTTLEVEVRGQRTRSHGMGQISIWPSLSTDQGLYICEVARIRDDLGRTSVHRKMFAVGVCK